MVYPQHDRVSQDFLVPVGPGKAFYFCHRILLRQQTLYTLSLYQCSARAAQDIEGHHRPVIASIFHPLERE